MSPKIPDLNKLFAELQRGDLSQRQFELLMVGVSDMPGRGFLSVDQKRESWEKHRDTLLAVADMFQPNSIPHAAFEFDISDQEPTPRDIADTMRAERPPFFTTAKVAELEGNYPILMTKQPPLPEDYVGHVQNLAKLMPAASCLQMCREWKAASWFHQARGNHHGYVKYKALWQTMAAELKEIQRHGQQPNAT